LGRCCLVSLGDVGPRPYDWSVPTPQLRDEDRRVLWEQFVEVYAESQESFDTSVRTLAAAGVAVTASLGTALGEFGRTGVAAAICFLVSLSFNIGSYATAQLDMRRRLWCLRNGKNDGVEGNWWTKGTTTLNMAAGGAFVAGGALLAAFVASAT
jgi:hypothetical protein